MGGDTPPELTPSCSYNQWKRDVRIWQLGTSVGETKQAARAILRMTGKVREYASRVPVDELKKVNGLEILITELDKYFKKDATQEVFLAIEELENFRRDAMTITEYIEEFTRLTGRVKELLDNKDPYEDGVLAYRILKQASLSEPDQKLVRATVTKLTFDEMVVGLKRCLGDGVVLVKERGSLVVPQKIKSEPMDSYYANRYDRSDEWEDDDYSYRHQQNVDYDDEEVFYQSKYRGNGKYRGHSRGARGSNYYKKNGGSDQRQRPGFSGNSYQKPHRNDKSNSLEQPKSPKLKSFPNMTDQRTGEVKRCGVCDSKYHFARDCPHKFNNASTMLQSAFCDYQLDIFNVDDDYESIMLVDETCNKALIDTGATTTVCGDRWLSSYLDSLTSENREKVIEIKARYMTFRFGDGRGIKSCNYVMIPINLCGKNLLMGTYVVEGNLPLLFSRSSLKEFNISLDIQMDKMSIDNVSQDLIVTETGHYVAELLQDEESKIVLLCNDSDVKKQAEKLHRYFGHPSFKRLKEVVQESDFNNKELIKEIEKVSTTCDHCQRYRRDRSRPKSSLLSPGEVNEIVCMDLKTLSTGHIMFHAIDLFSRFSTTTIIGDKNRETIINALFRYWISIFGRPNLFLTDNGGEFMNKDFIEMSEQLEISVKTTAAHAPFSNGVCERHNGVIADAYNKLIEDLHCDPEIALAWATNAKNSLNNSFGFSPYTLVFGRTPSIPGLSNIKMITSLNQTTVSRILLDHLNCMYQSRSAFLRANNSEKVKRALKDRICQVEERYFLGDVVHYKKENQKRWSGPATVIGQDGKLVFLRHGGFVLRVHVTKIILKSRADNDVINQSCVEEVSDKETPQENPIRKECVDHGIDSDDSSCDEEVSEDINNVDELDVSENIIPMDQSSVDHDTVIEEPDSHAQSQEKWTPIKNQQKNNNRISLLDVKAGDKVRYKKSEDSEFQAGTIISRAGKVTGKDKNEFNIQDENENVYQEHLDKMIQVEKAVECQEVSEIMYIEDGQSDESILSVTVPKSRYNEPHIQKAMSSEIDYWKQYKVYSEVKDLGQKTLSTRWVVTRKGNNNYKARLVVRGFEEDIQEQVDSPTGEKSSMRILLSVCVTNNWRIESIDIKGAFLQSEKLERMIHVRPPRQLKKPGIIWKLEKPAYGLSDSSRNWYISLSQYLVSIGCEKSRWDKALFYYRVSNKLCGIMLIHVDDFIMCGNLKFKEDVMKKLYIKYDISKHQRETFKYIGVNITQGKDYIKIDQQDYANSVKPVGVESSRMKDKDRILDEDEMTAYRSLLGKLQWIAGISRPDIKFDVFCSSRVGKDATVRNLIDLNKIVTKLRTEKFIMFPKLDLKENLSILVYSDASFKNLDNKVNSGRGYVIFLITGEVVCCLTWNSSKVNRVCISILEAETMALSDGVKHAEWLRAIVVEALYGNGTEVNVVNIICFTDSDQLYKNLYSTKYVSDHALRLNAEVLKEKLRNGVIDEVKHVLTEHQLADPLTKSGADPRKLDVVLMSGKHKPV